MTSLVTYRPDFFIVGAAKSSTTSAHHYLRQHPGVFMPQRPEMSFFGRDMTIGGRIEDLPTYLSYFEGAEPGQRIGEKSVAYLFSSAAAQEIHHFNPDAQIIVLLRNPVDMMFSLHGQSLYSANEDIVDFASALAAEPDRQAGLRIPAGAHNPSFLQYREMASYSSQLSRYLETFGRERVHVSLFEDMAVDPARTYRELLDFLGLEQFELESYEVRNPRKRVPNIGLRKFMKTHVRLSRAINRILPSNLVDRMTSAISATQRQPERRLDSELRRRLIGEFEEEIRNVEKVLDRDLSVWRT